MNKAERKLGRKLKQGNKQRAKQRYGNIITLIRHNSPVQNNYDNLSPSQTITMSKKIQPPA
jgi:hypothetical protein